MIDAPRPAPVKYELRVTPYRASSKRHEPLSFVATINGDEIVRSPRPKFVANAIKVALSHYGVEGITKERAREIVSTAGLVGAFAETFTGEAV